MKKKIFTALILACLLSSSAYGSASEDIYIRQDVFDAKMEAFMNEIRGEFQVINAKFAALDKRIDDLQTSTTKRIDDLQASTADRINDLQASTADRIDDLKTIIYWGLSILGLLIAFAIFGPSFGEFLRNLRKPSFTLEDVRRLIEENNVRLSVGFPHA